MREFLVHLCVTLLFKAKLQDGTPEQLVRGGHSSGAGGLLFHLPFRLLQSSLATSKRFGESLLLVLQ